MARYAIIIGTNVLNVIEATGGVANAIAAEVGGSAVQSDVASPGDTYLGGNFTRPEPPPPQIPQSVTRRQAKQALLLAGLLDGVQPAINAIPDATQRALIQIEWDDSQVFERQRPALVLLGTALGLGGAALDDLFVTADML